MPAGSLISHGIITNSKYEICMGFIIVIGFILGVVGNKVKSKL